MTADNMTLLNPSRVDAKTDVQQAVCLSEMLHDVLDGLKRIRAGESGLSPDEVGARMQRKLEMACQP